MQRFAPELEQRLRSHRQPTDDSWRVDETYVRVKGQWVYLYRAVDSSGATLDFLLSEQRDAAAAKRFLERGSEATTTRLRASSTRTSTRATRPPFRHSKKKEC